MISDALLIFASGVAVIAVVLGVMELVEWASNAFDEWERDDDRP
jgi:hypothetical protein